MEALAADAAYNPLGLGGANSNANVAKIAIDQRKKKQDVVEPQVISEELLIDGVEEPVKPDKEVWEPIEFPMVTSLRLSFLNIIEISNLCNFNKLEMLRLDNNIIDKIANLNHLTSLKWLDLSFNNIREIEGLDQLSNLLDLSLYHNQIEDIVGLDGCPNLNILSLGHNRIWDLKQIDYLRRFPNLRCVCLDGNKVCQHDSYNQHVLAYLPTLKYLDYMLIDRKAVDQAREGYNLEELTEIREKESSEATKISQKKNKQAVIDKLKMSFLDVTEDLFDDLFGKDTEPEHVTVLTCYPQLKENFRDAISEDIKQTRNLMEEKNEGRLKKKAAFEKAVTLAEKDSEEEAFQMVRHYRSYMKNRVFQIQGASDDGRDQVDAIVDQLKEHLSQLESQLMANEVQLQESIEEAAMDFEQNIQDKLKAMGEMGSEFFKKLEENHRFFHVSLIEQANTELEAFQQNQDSVALAESDPNKVKFLSQREEMVTAIANFSEAQGTMILNKDDQMSASMTKWKAAYFEGHRERQYHRNRTRIMDIKKVIDACKEEILAATEALEYDDDHADGG
jgi:hypothetical protein